MTYNRIISRIGQEVIREVIPVSKLRKRLCKPKMIDRIMGKFTWNCWILGMAYTEEGKFWISPDVQDGDELLYVAFHEMAHLVIAEQDVNLHDLDEEEVCDDSAEFVMEFMDIGDQLDVYNYVSRFM